MSITNNEVEVFSDSRIRPLADQLSKTYNMCSLVLNQYYARGINTLCPNDAAEVLKDTAYGTDGTDGDGRPVVNGADLIGVVVRASEFVTSYEKNSKAKLNTILSVAVHPNK